jgi:hypothetical protein
VRKGSLRSGGCCDVGHVAMIRRTGEGEWG